MEAENIKLWLSNGENKVWCSSFNAVMTPPSDELSHLVAQWVTYWVQLALNLPSNKGHDPC